MQGVEKLWGTKGLFGAGDEAGEEIGGGEDGGAAGEKTVASHPSAPLGASKWRASTMRTLVRRDAACVAAAL